MRRSAAAALALTMLAAPAADAASRHASVVILESTGCVVAHSETWTAMPGQQTLRLVFSDVTTGGSDSLDIALAASQTSHGAANLVGDSEASAHVWRLTALVLDGSESVLAKGKSKRVAVDCAIDAA